MSKAEFGDHVMHAVDMYRKSEQEKAREQERVILKKVAGLQLVELTERVKKKTEKAHV